MEIMNGANKITRAYDDLDARAVEVWDRLLCDGRKVTALGGSDAHSPAQIGIAWTGAFAPRRTAASIVEALGAGNCFASEAPIMMLSCDEQPMCATVRRKRGSNVELCFRIADAIGIASVRIVSDGRAIRSFCADGQQIVEGRLSQKAGGKPRYCRFECTAMDGRRAFSSPVYVEPEV